MSSVMKKKIRKLKAGTVLLCLLFTFGGLPVYAEEANNNETYLTIMRDFIDNIRNTTLG